MDLHLHFPAHLHHVSINLLIKHRANFTFLSVIRLFYIKPCQGCEKWTTLRTQHNTIQHNTIQYNVLICLKIRKNVALSAINGGETLSN